AVDVACSGWKIAEAVAGAWVEAAGVRNRQPLYNPRTEASNFEPTQAARETGRYAGHAPKSEPAHLAAGRPDRPSCRTRAGRSRGARVGHPGLRRQSVRARVARGGTPSRAPAALSSPSCRLGPGSAGPTRERARSARL